MCTYMGSLLKGADTPEREPAAHTHTDKYTENLLPFLNFCALFFYLNEALA